MQGRLCDKVDGQNQAFSWPEWQDEFKEAYRVGNQHMEWTLDQENLYTSPLITESGRKKIKSLSKKYNVDVISLAGDCFMQAPFWKATDATILLGTSDGDFKAVFENLSECKYQGSYILQTARGTDGRHGEII